MWVTNKPINQSKGGVKIGVWFDPKKLDQCDYEPEYLSLLCILYSMYLKIKIKSTIHGESFDLVTIDRFKQSIAGCEDCLTQWTFFSVPWGLHPVTKHPDEVCSFIWYRKNSLGITINSIEYQLKSTAWHWFIIYILQPCYKGSLYEALTVRCGRTRRWAVQQHYCCV
jgi:hypothetical protein